MLTERFNDALLFAERLHRSQTRKGTTVPYMSHLMIVAGLVLEYGGDETQAIAALLHDSIEDQAKAFGGADLLRAEIRNRYGEAVLHIVNCCTDSEEEPKPEWWERKRRYVSHIPGLSAHAALVSIADKIANARSIIADQQCIGNAVFARFNAGQEGTLWYYGELAKAFSSHHPGQGSAALRRCVAEMQQLAAAAQET